MMELFFAVIGSWFFVTWIGIFILCVISTENDVPVAAALIIILGLALTHGLKWGEPLLWIYTNPTVFLMYALVYIGIGVLWSFIKWDRYCFHKADNLTVYSSMSPKDIYNLMPSTYHNSHKFINWIFLWPASIFWFLLSDVISWIRDQILSIFDSVYSAIAKRHYDRLVRKATAVVPPKNETLS